MHITEALGWQGLWFFVFAYLLIMFGWIFWDRQNTGMKKLLTRGALILGILFALVASGLWMSTIWINYALNPLP